MRKSLRSIVAGAATLCVVGVMSAVGATSASAAAAPFDPTQDVNYVGTITFYNAAGQVVTSGDGFNPLSAQYMVGSVLPAGASPVNRTIVAVVGPQPSVNPGLWSGANINGSTLYPLPAPAPAVVSSATTPQGAMLATSVAFANAATAFTTNTGVLANMFQVRLKSAGTVYYNATTISIDPVTGVWTQIDPVPVVQVATTTTLAVTPASPANQPVNPVLTSHTTPAAAGSVQFLDGATPVGTPVAVAAGVDATTTVTAATAATHLYSAVFTPTDAAAFASSTSAVTSYVVNPPAAAGPVLALTVDNAAPSQGVIVNFTSTSTPVDPGTIQLFDGATALGTAVPAAATNTFAISFANVGPHSVTAKFVPTNTAAFTSTTSPAVSVGVLATGDCLLTGSSCTDAQSFTVNVPAGSIVISTPYSALNQFNMGAMALNTAGSQYSASMAFGDAANPALGVTITDTRAGGKGWTASLQSSDFINGTVGTINAGNLGFTGVTPRYLTNNLLGSTGHLVSVFDNAAPVTALGFPAAAPALSLATPQKFASTGIGAGSVNVTGLFTINAPSSVPAGQYDGTVTFTII